SEFAKVVTQRSQLVLLGAEPTRRQSLGMKVGGGKRPTSGKMGKAHQGVHQSQLPGIVQLQTWNPFAREQDGGLAQLAQLAAVNKGFQNVLLGGEIVVAKRAELLLECRQVLHRFSDPVVG